jgi:hypothetical protein
MPLPGADPAITAENCFCAASSSATARPNKSGSACYAMVRHRTVATGITAYLKNGGTLENAAAMANHASTRTTQLYDRRRDAISLDEVERVRV